MSEHDRACECSSEWTEVLSASSSGLVIHLGTTANL